MSEVRFYHLTRTSLDSALYGILEKAVGQGMRTVVDAGSPERAEQLSAQLWTVQPSGFLPHGTAKDGMPERQPIYIGENSENLNGATLLVMLGGQAPPDPEAFSLCCLVFEDRDADAVVLARKSWKSLKEAGGFLSYWQQGENGGWQKTA
ncbi:MAG TPA: DNA polymerase III subunit chi [Rhodospirillaceae bacterium]|nr:MAG: hypothetical protein A2018_02430 [Alphaproteobacteria bacterium GWF2_58_20]HAU29495.1 DNA polymerase III subunit chi [Rhodospirillaceae bacterium]